MWNAMPHHLNTIQDLENFKRKVIQFMLSIPDKPPIGHWGLASSQQELTAVLQQRAWIYIAMD
jgi:hypothetical protein